MSRKRTTYTAEFKTKLVLEVLKEDKTLNEIASVNNITPKNLQNWKKIFLENAEVAMEPAKVIKEYKEENVRLQAKLDEYAKVVGQLTVEKDWAVGKLSSLDSSYKKELIDRDENKALSVVKQCNLINYNRSNLFYAPMVNLAKNVIKKHIEKVFEEIPSYGYMKVYHQLLEDGFRVSPNTVLAYRRELGLQAVLAVRPPNTSWADKQHHKYSYKIRGLDIVRANQVWSTDITYIKIKGGMVYMAAIIDWYSKAILSWRISNTMDTDLVIGVLDEALALYGKPEIFNTDQGSQYTSCIHTQTLKDNDIIISMDGKGRATDNICIERFWRSAKVEKIYLNEYERVSILKSDVKDYIEFYNHRRFHETLKYKKPMNVYYDSLKINDENYTKSSENVA
ncbi:IS3 family transposase [Sulfurimonas sp.]|uniref:IS3 family transposase n=1 Tax=Sulfurimonas sp. TaxID=2022749 RepID=UPI002B47417F|nr:IS3 family transposase [Sulfurimonas sp.]